MIRRVAFGKAILAGALGALAWELVVRVLIWLGLPLFDLVYVLGTMVLGAKTVFWQWWLVGIAMHVSVGAIWAIFYSYFFWSIFDLPPLLQGMIFSLMPALLAGLIMIPQMDLMLDGRLPAFRSFAIAMGWLGPGSVLLGHLVYGTVMGGLYTKPVGYRAGRGKAQYG